MDAAIQALNAITLGNESHEQFKRVGFIDMSAIAKMIQIANLAFVF